MTRRILLGVVLPSVLMISAFGGMFVMQARAAGTPESIMPSHGLVAGSAPIQVIVKNPDGVLNKSQYGNVTFKFDQVCDLNADSEYHAIAQHDHRVLVQVDVAAPFTSMTEGGVNPCFAGVIFWRSEQQFRMAAQAYRERAAQQAQAQSEQELIRTLLNTKQAASR